MRPVLVSDLTSAARVLLAVEPLQRMEMAAQMLKEAEFADRYTRRFRRVHAVFGDGTLAGAARKRTLAVEPTFDNIAYCECLELLVQHLLAWRIGPVRP